MAAGHAPRRGGARAPGGPLRGGDGRQRAVLRRAGPVRGEPAGGRRPGGRGDADLHPAHGLHRRRATRSRRRRPRRPAAAAVVEHAPEVAEVDLVARVVSTEEPEPDLSGSLKSARVVVGAGRGAGSEDGFDDLLELADLLGAPLGRLAGRHLPGLAPAPRAGGPDGEPDLARPLHPLRHQRSHPALGRVQQREGDPGHQHRPRRADGHQGDPRRDRRPARGRARPSTPRSGVAARADARPATSRWARTASLESDTRRTPRRVTP